MAIAVITAIAVSFILYSLKNNLSIFLTPKQVITQKMSADKLFRIGGLVKKNSVKRNNDSLSTEFIVTDNHADIIVRFTGILPDLFRENSGVIAEGKLNKQNEFIATTVLAKHDETYMPKNVYQSLREST